MLQRTALEASPLADLHELATEVGLEGFRKLRKADLIDRLLDAPSSDAGANGSRSKAEPAPKAPKAKVADTPRDEDEDDDDRGGRRSRGRSRRGGRDDDAPSGDRDRGERSERGDRGGRERDRSERDRDRDDSSEDRQAEGVVEVLAGGTGFIRVKHPEQTDDDVYVSAAQIRRCELVTGDRIGGPFRAPRRSERFPSLVRVETINGKPAEEVAGDGVRFTDAAATYPAERFELGADADVTLKAIEWLAPIGRGSRVVVHGAAHSGKTEVLRKLVTALAKTEGLDLQVVLAGARPEEVTAWSETDGLQLVSAPLGASLEQQNTAIERAVDQARRVAQRGGDAVVVIDSIGELAPHVARRTLASARNLVDGGSVTIIAAAPVPVGGETTLIALDAAAAGGARFDLQRSSTLRPDLLVGPEGAAAIQEARSKAS